MCDGVIGSDHDPACCTDGIRGSQVDGSRQPSITDDERVEIARPEPRIPDRRASRVVLTDDDAGIVDAVRFGKSASR